MTQRSVGAADVRERDHKARNIRSCWKLKQAKKSVQPYQHRGVNPLSPGEAF